MRTPQNLKNKGGNGKYVTDKLTSTTLHFYVEGHQVWNIKSKFLFYLEKPQN